MCLSSLLPALGLIGVIGTPASSAPMTATATSGSFTAHAATRSCPATRSATAAAASRSCAYVSVRSPNRSAIWLDGSASASNSTRGD